MEKIQPGKFVALAYDLYEVNDNGEEKLVHQTDVNDPETLVVGATQGVIVPLETALNGLSVGDKFDVVATAEEAFGPRSEEDIVTLSKEIFKVDGKFDSNIVKVGEYVPLMTSEGYRINGKVLEITGETVILDFNHPLAGKSVRFKGKVLEVRDATAEDLQPMCGCGCGDHGCGCGDDCNCTEDDHCGCGGHCH